MSKAKGISSWIYGLCFLSGYTNGIGILKFGVATSHVTGSITKIADKTVKEINMNFYLILTVILTYFLGNIISGIIINKREFGLRNIYGLIIKIIGVFILFFTNLLYDKKIFLYILPLVMGIQNGLFITYKGVVVRTTHMTGTVTDLGTSLGQMISGNKVEFWKIQYYFLTLTCFFLGGITGGKLFILYDKAAFNLLGLGYIILGILYIIIKFRKEEKDGKIFYNERR